MTNKTIFLVEADPFPRGTPEEAPDWYIYQRSLMEERDDVYLTQGTHDIERFPRELYTAFNTREEALIHLDRLATDTLHELEKRTSKLQHFINTIDDEIRKP
ncbi:hypothetical protein [Enterobacter hormaechei]|uniref:hypothetical protein n=1 Tax=Enterobacter hormaechei TaxID=158836 RepID=UPI002023285F|nr:hypothetical protein [Enterobacter hormaechei]MCL8356371.1 hypothetical protein [Enterobacter hormaechei subsp. xiangfangensis]